MKIPNGYGQWYKQGQLLQDQGQKTSKAKDMILRAKAITSKTRAKANSYCKITVVMKNLLLNTNWSLLGIKTKTQEFKSIKTMDILL